MKWVELIAYMLGTTVALEIPLHDNNPVTGVTGFVGEGRCRLLVDISSKNK